MKKILTTLTAVLLVLFAYGQVAIEKTPPSFTKTMTKTVTTHQLPTFDVQAMLADDEATKGEEPLRFGKRHKVAMSPKTHGTWERLSNGDRIWRITFTSVDAYSLNFLFSKFKMPEGAEFYAYNADKSDVRGAFTAQNNKSDGVFAITPIDGETVTLEYFEPAAVRGQGLIEISHVVHAYRNLHDTMAEILEKDYGDSGACNNDVACSESTGWENQIRSVAFVIVDGNRSCSGAMVNNVAQDGTPYFLSANHCGTDVNNTWSFVFNYDSPTCDGPDGDLSQSITGGVLRANYEPSDFSLVELSLPPPSSYVVYYAGWNKLNEAATSSTGIHHPAGDVKKISFNDDKVYEGNWGVGDTPVADGDHWIVDNWEDGTTEGGSSGSPLFDQNKLIIGQLHGGGASCSNVVYDSYGKFYSSWEGGGTPNTRLVDWLGDGKDTLHGAYFIEPPLAFNIQAVNVSGADGVLCDGEVTPEVLVRNIGGTDITSFTIVYGYDGNLSNTFEWTGGPLGFYQSVTVGLPTLTLGLGMHTFDAIISSPNGSMDDDISNDSIASAFNVIEGNILTINLLADTHPEETAYQITDRNTGEALYTVISDFQENTLNIDDICLDDGCYIFTIYDAEGDGICCSQGEGNYELVTESGDIIGSGGEFEEEESIEFCLPFILNANFSTFKEVCVDTPVTVENGSQLATAYTWSAPGATLDMSTDESPTFTYDTPGIYTITLTVEDSINSSTTSQEIEVFDGNGLLINLLTDEYPGETSYFITEQGTGETVFAAEIFDVIDRLYIEHLCLAEGCYTFTIVDSFGDGICCNVGEGSYEILDNNSVSIAFGGDFADQEVVDFCLPFAGVQAFADFSIKPSICAGEPVTVDNNSSNATSYSWSAPSATPDTSTDKNPTFTFDEAGTYTITLIASNEISDNTVSQDITVYEVPVAGPITGAEMPVNGETETYTTPLNSGSVYKWRVEGGTQVSGGNTNTIEVMWNDPNNMAFVCITETDANGCQSTEFCYDVVTVVGVEDIAFQKGLNIFPNPTDGMLYIESNEVPDNIEVFDVIGQRIAIDYQNNSIDMTQQATGIYLVRITYEEGSVTRRIIVE